MYILNSVGPILQLVLVFIGIIIFGLIGTIIARVATRLFMSVFIVILYIFEQRDTAIEN